MAEPVYLRRSGNNRFDAPAAEYGVLYAGSDAHCAFIETFGHETGRRVADPAELRLRASPGWAEYLTAERAEDAESSLGDWGPHASPDAARAGGETPPLHRTPTPPALSARSAISAVNNSRMEPANAGLLADILDTYGFGLLG